MWLGWLFGMLGGSVKACNEVLILCHVQQIVVLRIQLTAVSYFIICAYNQTEDTGGVFFWGGL